MKSIIRYILLLSVFCGIISSCSFDEDFLLPEPVKGDGNHLVIATVENFSAHDVATKATDDQERKINNITMLVFGKKGDDMVLITNPLYVDGEQLNFVINTTPVEQGQYVSNLQGAERQYFGDFDDNGGDLTACRIYLVANMNTQLRARNFVVGTSESVLLDTEYHLLANVPQGGADVNAIDVPEGGFPMIGSFDADLSPNSTLGSGSQTAQTISLKKLFAKINVKFLVQLNKENIPGGMNMVKTPYFAPIEWSVSNIPNTLSLRDSEPQHVPVETVFDTQKFTTFSYSTTQAAANGRIENSDAGTEYLSFSFYVPEYKVLPLTDRTHADYAVVDPDLLQYFKPQFFGNEGENPQQYPTYITIKGRYSDHQGNISEVQYKLYLGQNEIDDYQVLRNQQLNNTATIRGLRSHSGGIGDVSIDHRVDVTSSGYSIAMERETLLDSHFEFRPMDITVQEGAVVVVRIPEPENNQTPWYAAERADMLVGGASLYDPTKPGLRKFFTDGLIDELRTATSSTQNYFVFHGPAQNSDGVVDQKTYRIWFYFDENTGMRYDDSAGLSTTNKLYRQDNILVDFYDSYVNYNNGVPKTRDREFTFRQMAMWTINGHLTQKQYSIEYFEEYLYNYAADDNFGVTRDGMAWGLNNQQLSTQYQAIYADDDGIGGILGWLGWTNDEFFNTAFSSINAKYDFYLSRDGLNQQRNYSGLAFTQEIVNKTDIMNKTITLSQNAESAVEYCYNKNKRNRYGEVVKINWYLPAIDETEEILVDGFNYFPVFQSKWYWSSQPAYDRCNYTASVYVSWLGSAEGYYFRDDLDRARATRVTGVEGDATHEDSGVTGAVVERDINVRSGSNVDPGTERATGETITYDPGNQLRTASNRVRCVYDPTGKPITGSDPARYIYGTYTVNISTSASGATTPITVTISKSDDASEGNVKLSNYLHTQYYSTNYPQYATYDESTGRLTINMGQQIGTYNNRNVYSRVYNRNNQSTQQTLVLIFNESTESFTVSGNNVNLGGYYTTSDYFGTEREISTKAYIRSMIKQ